MPCKAEKLTLRFQVYSLVNQPVPGTEFSVTLAYKCKDNIVKLFLPDISFQIPYSAEYAPLQGGIVCSVQSEEGRLPPCIRPSYKQTVVASTNDGFQPVWLDAQLSGTQPIAPCYNVLFDEFGNVRITGTGQQSNLTMGNDLSLGGHTLNAQILEYYIGDPIHGTHATQLLKGISYKVLQRKPTNFLQNPENSLITNETIRDSHRNDAHDGVTLVTWSGNADVTNKTQAISDTFAAVGHIQKNGETTWVVEEVNLTNFSATDPVSWSFDTAGAISRTDTKFMIVSAGLNADNETLTGYPAYKYTQDGGLTWKGMFPVDQVNFPVSGGNFADCPGVIAASNGGFFYVVSNLVFDDTNPAGYDANVFIYYLAPVTLPVSGPLNWTLIYQTTDSPGPNGYSIYDYPQVTFGPNGAKQEGLWIVVDYISYNFEPIDGYAIWQSLLFTPINSDLTAGPTVQTQYSNQVFSNELCVPTVDQDGQLYLAGFDLYILYEPIPLSRKQPPNSTVTDPMDPSLMEYSQTIVNLETIFPGTPDTMSDTMTISYFPQSANSQQYDIKRNALFIVLVEPPTYNNQNYSMKLRASVNKGHSWSIGYELLPPDSKKSRHNKGYQSMALDYKTGTMTISFYNAAYTKGTSWQVWNLVVSKKVLDELVCQLK